MGKGDIKSKRGKIWNGSYGKKRLRRSLRKSEISAEKSTDKKDKKK
jgi:ribosomal small subunit protein bTHX